MKTIRVRPGRERSLLRRHPWIFEGSVDRGKADAGETVRVEGADGRFLAWAAWSPQSLIRLRVWSFDEAERIDAAFFARRIEAALALRRRLPIDSDAMRLVHGESDGLPGLVVDRYGDTLVAQFLAAGVERWKPVIAGALLKASGARRLYERSDTSAREREGLPPVTGWLRAPAASHRDSPAGATDASAATAASPTSDAADLSTALVLREHGWRFGLDIASGHKTGFYLDQRDNRRRFADWIGRLGCRRVLNGYAYTGGFSVAALAGGASEVVSVDSSAPALEHAVANVASNGFDAGRHQVLDADVNATLRRALEEGRRFDAIVLDPPKLAPTASHAERAARAYKDINRLALMLLEAGGLLFTFSCSGGISADLFHKIVAGAGMDAGVDGFILERLGAAPDHPMTIDFPEGEYLKGLALLKR